MPVVQDGPPPGGFPPLRYARRLPSTGPTGFTLFAVAGAIMAYGFVKIGQTNHHRRCTPFNNPLSLSSPISEVSLG